MATERELIAKVLELREALQRYERAQDQVKRLDAALQGVNDEQLDAQNEVVAALTALNLIRGEVKFLL